MSTLFHVMDAVASAPIHVLDTVADSVPNPPPVAIPGLDGKTNMVLGWLKSACLIAIVGGALLAIIMIPAGKAAGNRMTGNIGLAALGAAALGAVLYVVIVPILNALLG